MVLFVLTHLLFIIQNKQTPLQLASKYGGKDVAALIEACLETKKEKVKLQVSFYPS